MHHPLNATPAIAPRGSLRGGAGGRKPFGKHPGDLQAVPCRDEAAILGRLLMQ